MISICRALLCGWAAFGDKPINNLPLLLDGGGDVEKKGLSLATYDKADSGFSTVEGRFSLQQTNEKVDLSCEKVDLSCGFKFPDSTERGAYSNYFRTIKVNMYNKEKNHLQYNAFNDIYNKIRTAEHVLFGVRFPAIESKGYDVNQIECFIEILKKKDRENITLFMATGLERLPFNIGRLENLKEINLRNSKVIDLGRLPEFKNLITIKLPGLDYENYETMGLMDQYRQSNCADSPVVATVARWLQTGKKTQHSQQLNLYFLGQIKVLLPQTCTIESLHSTMFSSIRETMFLFDFDGKNRGCASIRRISGYSFYRSKNCIKEAMQSQKINGCLLFDNYPKYYAETSCSDCGVMKDKEGIPGSQELVMKFLTDFISENTFKWYTEITESIRLPEIKKIYQIPSWLRDDEDESRGNIKKIKPPIWVDTNEIPNEMMEILKKFKNLKNLKIPSSLPVDNSEHVDDYYNKIARSFLKDIPSLERFQIGNIEIDLNQIRKESLRLKNLGDVNECSVEDGLGDCLVSSSETT